MGIIGDKTWDKDKYLFFFFCFFFSFVKNYPQLSSIRLLTVFAMTIAVIAT